MSPDGTLTNFIEEISKKYRSSEKGLEKLFECVTNYDGSTIEKTVHKLNAENELISSEYHALIEAIANPDSEVESAIEKHKCKKKNKEKKDKK